MQSRFNCVHGKNKVKQMARIYPTRYSALLGFNTKQVWLYDEVNDCYIEPPSEILEQHPDEDEAQEYLEEIANSDNPPEWLSDTDYIYDGDIDI